MMAWFVLGLVLLTLFVATGRYLVKADPGQVAGALRGAGGILAAALGTLLALRGQIAFGAPLIFLGIGAFIPDVRPWGWSPGGPSAFGRRKSGGGRSRVETATVAMTLDHDTGAMDGEVLKGGFAGRTLASLAEAELEALRQEALGDDPDAAALITAYLDHRFGGRREEDERPGGETRQGAMTRKEAYAVLGLQPGAEADDIRAAHKKLMLKAHPDQGGSSWLAAKINEAKETLLGPK